MKPFLSRFLFLTILLTITPTSYARVGGGESYDDGGSSDYSDNSSDNSSSSYDNSSYYESNDDSGGSSGPADFKLVFWLFVLPIFLFFVFYQFGRLKEFIDQKREKWMYWKNAKWMKKIPSFHQAIPDITQKSAAWLRENDRDFSEYLLKEFTGLLIHRILDAKDENTLRPIYPFLQAQLRSQLIPQLNNNSKREMIGKIEWEQTYCNSQYAFVMLRADINLVLKENDKNKKCFFRYKIVLQRSLKDRTLPPERTLSLNCPACGAGSDYTDAGICKYCNSTVVDNNNQWKLYSLKVEDFKSLSDSKSKVPQYAVEKGTDYPTPFHIRLEQEKKKFCERHSLNSFVFFETAFKNNIVTPTFLHLYECWDKNDWEKTRMYLSDHLFEVLKSYLNENQESGFKNRLQRLNVSKIETAKLEMDGKLEILTVRIFASCIDFYTDLNGKKVSGDDKNPRSFSEYWTFIRHASGKEKEFNPEQCPNCSAQQEHVSQHSICSNCGTKVNAGQFNWVLSDITQDEAYKG